MTEQTPDLSNLISEEKKEEAQQDVDVVEEIGKSISSLSDSFASMHIYVRTLDQRLSALERYVAYLLEKDPQVAEKIKEHLAKADAEAKAQDGSQV